jgi:hypothetical protein
MTSLIASLSTDLLTYPLFVHILHTMTVMQDVTVHGPGSKQMSHRVSVNFSDSALLTLQKIAQKRGKTMSEVLRDAIELENYVTEAASEGSKIFIEKADGKIREIVAR